MTRTIRNPNHPKKGASIKVEPIKCLDDIAMIKAILYAKPRDHCLFTLGINTAYRANELVAITVGQVAHLQAGDRFEIKQSKNKRYRSTTFNQTVVDSVQRWLHAHPNPVPNSPLFFSQKSKQALLSVTVTQLVKKWCKEAGLHGNYGSHTLRKTWGYHQRCTYGHHTALLTAAYGHASESQTMEYLCIQPDEINELYAGEL